MGRSRKLVDEHGLCESVGDSEIAFDTSQPVDALVLEYGGGRSVRQIERDAEVSQGNYNRYIGRSRIRKYPTLEMIQGIAAALGAPLNRVSRALATEAGIPELHDGDPEPELAQDEAQMLEHLRRLPQDYRALLIHQVVAAAEWHARETEAGGTP